MESVARMVRRHLPSLPRAETMVVRTLLANYPAAALDTVATLADEAGVSAPTVLRLVERIGFGSFTELQDALRRELREKSLAPVDQYSQHDSEEDPLMRARAVFNRGLAETFESMPSEDFQSAVRLLAEGDRVFATGGRFSFVLAKNLVTTLEVLRPATTFLSIEDRATMLADFVQGDVLFVVDLRRYQPSTIVFGREAAARGVRLVLLTDRWHSPLADLAEAVIACSVEAPHPLDSMVAAIACTEALVAGVVDALGQKPVERMRQYDAAWASVGFGNEDGARFDAEPTSARSISPQLDAPKGYE